MVKQREIEGLIVTLPIDIYIEILAKLPAKSLLRCRCVSKVWCSLIDDPKFPLIHLKNYQINQKKSHLLVLEPPRAFSTQHFCAIRSADKFKKMYKLEIDCTWYERYQVIGYTNGLLCIGKFVLQNQLHKIFLWNPSIRKALELPFPQFLPSVGQRFIIDYAFGFDIIKNDYKVVASLNGNDFQNPRFAGIFTLSTLSWKSVDISNRPCYWHNACPKAFHDGIIYWSGIDVLINALKVRRSHFVSFNVHTEAFKYIKLPKCELVNELSDHCLRYPVILEQSVGLMEIFETHCQIWEMKEEEEGTTQSWTKRYKINLQLFGKNIYLKMDGELLVWGSTGRVNSYNLKNQEIKVLGKGYKLSPLFTTTYMESLVLLKGNFSQKLTMFP